MVALETTTCNKIGLQTATGSTTAAQQHSSSNNNNNNSKKALESLNFVVWFSQSQKQWAG